MGCGIDFDSESSGNYVRVFFTKNGTLIGNSHKMKRPVHGLYPLFGKRYYYLKTLEAFTDAQSQAKQMHARL